MKRRFRQGLFAMTAIAFFLTHLSGRVTAAGVSYTNEESAGHAISKEASGYIASDESINETADNIGSVESSKEIADSIVSDESSDEAAGKVVSDEQDMRNVDQEQNHEVVNTSDSLQFDEENKAWTHILGTEHGLLFTVSISDVEVPVSYTAVIVEDDQRVAPEQFGLQMDSETGNMLVADEDLWLRMALRRMLHGSDVLNFEITAVGETPEKDIDKEEVVEEKNIDKDEVIEEKDVDKDEVIEEKDIDKDEVIDENEATKVEGVTEGIKEATEEEITNGSEIEVDRPEDMLSAVCTRQMHLRFASENSSVENITTEVSENIWMDIRESQIGTFLYCKSGERQFLCKDWGSCNWFADDVSIQPVVSDSFVLADEKNLWEADGPLFAEKLTYKEAGAPDSDHRACVFVRQLSNGAILSPYLLPEFDFDRIAPNIIFNEETLELCVTESNFDASAIQLFTDGSVDEDQGRSEEDIQRQKVQSYLQDADNWMPDSDASCYRLSLAQLPADCDGNYQMSLHISDFAGNASTETMSFVLDRKAPEILSVSYNSEQAAGFISDDRKNHYYYRSEHSPVVTLCASDEVSGVDAFHVYYEREFGVSESNLKSLMTDDPELQTGVDDNGGVYLIVPATPLEEDVNISAEDVSSPEKEASTYSENLLSFEKEPTVYMAELYLPRNSADQLYGHLSVTAVDAVGNETATRMNDNGNIIIVDTISPELTAVYGEVAEVRDGLLYFTGDIEATFTVKEADFLPEDITVELMKVSDLRSSGWETEAISLSWETLKGQPDCYTASYVIPSTENHSTDGTYHFQIRYTDRSGNRMQELTDILVLDSTAPALSVIYRTEENLPAEAYNQEPITAVVTVKERYFDPARMQLEVAATDADGDSLPPDNLMKKSDWTSEGDLHRMTIVYSGDANYKVSISGEDIGGNQISDRDEDAFTVDQTVPEVLSVTYSRSVLDTVLDGIGFGFYQGKIRATITAADRTSGIASVQYRFHSDADVSALNLGFIEGEVGAENLHYETEKSTVTAMIDLPADVWTEQNQLSGNLSVFVCDRAGNVSAEWSDGRHLITDTIAPDCAVTYTEPVNEVGSVKYFDEAISGTITVKEANFYAEDLQFSVNRNGQEMNTPVTWMVGIQPDMRVGTFLLEEDGEYQVQISYTDKSGNAAAEYVSDMLIVDTILAAPVLTVNGEDADQRAFRDEVIPGVSIHDQNFAGYEVELTQSTLTEIGKNVTDEYLAELPMLSETGGTLALSALAERPENDGIYCLTAVVSDLAGHTVTSSIRFSVNRYGSVYEFGTYLQSLAGDEDIFLKNIEEDLVIMEYNADEIVHTSFQLVISRDGTPVANPDVTVTEQKKDVTQREQQSDAGLMQQKQVNTLISAKTTETIETDHSWHSYEYRISKSNFKTEGLYKINLSSEDAAGNQSDVTEAMATIAFWVDRTPPELTSVTGMEQSVVDAQEVSVQYSAYDTVGLSSLVVFVDQSEILRMEDFGRDDQHYVGTVLLRENPSAQHVRIVLGDRAGNQTDTDDKEQDFAFAFCRDILISTDRWVRISGMRFLKYLPVIAGVLLIVFIGLLLSQRKIQKKSNQHHI